MSYPKLPNLQARCFLCLLFLLGGCLAQEPATNSPLELLDHLAGEWVLQGTIAEKQTTHEVQVVTFTRERADHVVLDESLRADVEAMRRLHPGDLHFNGRDHADRVWILGFTADDGPVAYYAFDRTTREGTFLFAHKPSLEAYTLAAMEPFSFTSRDGLVVHGLHGELLGAEGRADAARRVDPHLVLHRHALGAPVHDPLAVAVGDVGHEIPAERDVQQLHAAADAEHRQVGARERGARELHLEAVALG